MALDASIPAARNGTIKYEADMQPGIDQSSHSKDASNESVDSAEQLENQDKTDDDDESKDSVPPVLATTQNQNGLWGSHPKGAVPERKGRQTPKRRWTVAQD